MFHPTVPFISQKIESHGIFFAVRDPENFASKRDEPSLINFTLEDGILNTLAVIEADFGNPPEPAGTAFAGSGDIVGDKYLHGLFDEERRVSIQVSPDVAGKQAGLDMGEESNGHFFVEERVGDLIALSFLPGSENGFSRIVLEKNSSGLLGSKIGSLDLSSVQQGQCHSICEERAEFFHEIECERGATGPVAVEKPALRVEAAGLECRPAIVHEEAGEEGEEGIDGIAGRAAGTAIKRNGRIVIGEKLWDSREVSHGGIPFDSTQLIEGNGPDRKPDPPLEEIDHPREFKCAAGIFVPVIPRGPLEDISRIRDFGSHDVLCNGEAGGFAVGPAVLLSSEKDVPRSESICRRKKLAVRGMEGERDARLSAACHEGRAGDRIIAKADDALEVMKRDAEFCLAIVLHLDRLAILAEVGSLERDKERVEVSFQWT